MTTAHRPTFDPAKGKNSQASGTILHTRSLPAHTQLKFRQPGQGSLGDYDMHKDMKTELLRKEEEHFKKTLTDKRASHGNGNHGGDDEEPRKKLRLTGVFETEVTQKEEEQDQSSSDASSAEEDDSGSDSGSDSASDSEDEDSEDELQRELEKIKAERAEAELRAQQKAAAREQAEREQEIAYGNPLLNPEASKGGASSRRKWNDDVVFKNQAKGVDDKKNQGFINDTIRSDFHRKFMNKYIK